MSAADSATRTLTSFGNPWLSALMSGSDAAVTTLDDALNRGLSTEQALNLGLASGLGETLMEKVSLGTILDQKMLSGNWLKNAAKSAGVEGLEEVSTELWNTIADVIISQDKSNWQVAIDSYKEQGLDENTAFWRAVGDKALELGYNFLAGATSGGMMHAGHLMLNAGQIREDSNNRNALGAALDIGLTTKQLSTEQIQTMINEGLAFGKGTDTYMLATQLQNKLKKGKGVSGIQLADLMLQSYTDAAKTEGRHKGITMPQIDLSRTTGTNPADVNTAVTAAPSAHQRQEDVPNSPDMAAPEAMDASGGLVPGAAAQVAPAQQQAYDINEVFSAAKEAFEKGSIPQARYDEMVETLAYAQSDLAEGNVTEEGYQATLAQIMKLVQQAKGGTQVESSATAEDLQVNVPTETWELGQRLAKALGRDIVFYNGPAGENGKYADGKIYVNVNAADPVAQVIAHELTHSIEGTKHYDRLKRFVLTELARQNVDIAQARKTKYDQYKSQGVALDSDAKIDAEIVAEFVQKRLLTNEADIRSLVQAEPGVAKRFWDKIKNWGKRLVGSADSRTAARLEHMEGLYRKAFAESNKGDFTPGSVAVQDGAVAQAQTDSVTEQRRQTEEAYARGELSDEDYDAAMDEFDRAEEERIGRSAEKYSFGGTQKNTAGSGGVTYGQGQQTAQADVTSRYQTAVDQILNMQNTHKDHLIIGYTPDVYRSLGMPSLPFVIGTGHVYSAAKTEAEAIQDGNFRKGTHYHGLGADTVKNIYESLQDPVIIIASKDVSKNATPLRSTHNVVAIVNIGNSEKSLLLPVEITAERTVNGVRMDVNALSSIYERDVTTLIEEAIAQENTGDIGVYYAKKEALTLPGAGVQFPIRLQQSIASNGIIHRFSEKVNMNIQDATQSKQFKRWFGDWQNYPEGASKVVNADGTPKVVYHGSYSNFSVFDGKGQKHSGAPSDTHFFTDDIDVGYSYTGYKNVAVPGGHAYKGGVYECYLNIRNPYTVDFQGKHWSDKVNGMDINELAQYAKDHGYDGLIAHNVIDEGGQGDANWDENVPKKPATTYVVFASEQIKSATDNIGTFDGSNPDIRYSFSSPKVKEQGRPLEGWYDSDEKQLQAKKAGYPVLKAEQVVPYATWVRSEERGNYGLVTGKTDDGRLLVSFHNKHDGSMARDVAIHPDMLTPVEGAYQMTKEEFASLMESEPLDVSEQAYTAEEVRELEELFRRSGGEENGTAQSIDMDKLPRKAQKYLHRAKRRLLNDLAKRLGVSKFADRSYLQATVDEICTEYLTNGRVSDEKMQELFEQAYEQGIVVDREFYDQYKEIKDHLRTTAVTISERDKSDIADFGDFRRRQSFRLRITDKGGMPVDSFYDALHDMAPNLFPESITHPADQLVRMAEVAQSIAISEQSLGEYAGRDRNLFKAMARNEFDTAAGEMMGRLYNIRRYADSRAAAEAKKAAPATVDEAMEVFGKLKKARRTYDRTMAKNLLTEHDEMLVGRLLRHEMELQHLDPETDNVGTQLAALAGVMDEKQFAKVRIAYDLNVDPDTYVTLKERLPEYDADKNGSMTCAEVKAAVDFMRGLSTAQRAVLWQLTMNSKSAKNNPYSTVVGQQVLDAKNNG